MRNSTHIVVPLGVSETKQGLLQDRYSPVRPPLQATLVCFETGIDLSQTQYDGAVAACCLAQGSDLPATVLPFILDVRRERTRAVSSASGLDKERLAHRGWLSIRF